MKINTEMKSWVLAAFLALFLSACATTQEEIGVDEDGAPIDGQVEGDGSGTTGGTDGGATASGLDDDGTGDGTAIVDDGSGGAMGAAEMLEQSDGDLSVRIVYFEFDSAKLTDESIAVLETHGNFIAGNGEVKVRLEGHTDERGSREYNIALGDRRAQSVRRVLLFQGASSDQIETVSYGEERPAVAESNEEAWSRNRRVELIYTVN